MKALFWTFLVCVAVAGCMRSVETSLSEKAESSGRDAPTTRSNNGLPVAPAPFERTGEARQPVRKAVMEFLHKGRRHKEVRFVSGEKSVLVGGFDRNVDINRRIGFGRVVVYAGEEHLATLFIQKGWNLDVGEDEEPEIDETRGTATWRKAWQDKNGVDRVCSYTVGGDGEGRVFRDISFDRCFVDGLHLNGNLTRVLVRNVRGQAGDDLVALNAYDWLRSSVDFGPQRFIVCEDLELVRIPGVPSYPAIRIQPAKYRYADGSVIDCSVSDVIFRRVKGISTFKMYLQTPRYAIGTAPEWSEVGSGGNLFFSDLGIDLAAPIDKMGQYATQEAPRGHFAAFEFGANLSLVHFKNIDVTLHADKWPLTHLAQVGPKSCLFPGKDGDPDVEIFDPYVNCRVDRVVLENVRVFGTPPDELVHASVFDDIDKDGHSSGRGVIGEIERLPGPRA